MRTRWNVPVLSLSLLCALDAVSAAHARPPSSPQIVLHHGAIFTADPARPWAEAILIDGDRIARVGTSADVLAAAPDGARRYDLGGRTVIPGLNDAHVHVALGAGLYLNTADFLPGPGPTLADVQSLLANADGSVPAGQWLFVLVGTAVLDDPGASRLALDAFSPNHPVALFAWSGHGTIVNTRGLQSLGIALDSPDPFGGSYERLPSSNVLSGVAHEYAEYGIRRRLFEQSSDADLVALYRAHAAQAVRLGYTSIQDIPVGLTHARALAVTTAANLPIRVRSICFPLTPDERCDAPCPWAPEPDAGARVTQSGIKWIADGTPIERRAFVTRPYIDRPNWLGEFNFAEDALLDFVGDAFHGSPRRSQLLFHAVGDGAVERVLGALEATGPAPAWSARRPRIEHGDLLFGGDIDRVARLGVVIVQNATHLALTGLWYQRYAPDVVQAMEPLRSLVARGVPLALGTDGIGRVLSPFVDIFLATVHPTHPSEALTVEQAVVAYTRGSAYAEFAENAKGTIAPGMLADIAVLSQDIFHLPPPALPATYSLLTLVGGEVVWDAGAITAE